MMKALTIKNPWASLIMNGLKCLEVRTKPTKYRGQLLLHAAARPAKVTAVDVMGGVCLTPILEVDGRQLQRASEGCFFAVARIADMLDLTDQHVWEALRPVHRCTGHIRANLLYHHSDALTKKLYGWLLVDVKLVRPWMAKGRLGLWEYDMGEREVPLIDIDQAGGR